ARAAAAPTAPDARPGGSRCARPALLRARGGPARRRLLAAPPPRCRIGPGAAEHQRDRHERTQQTSGAHRTVHSKTRTSTAPCDLGQLQLRPVAHRVADAPLRPRAHRLQRTAAPRRCATLVATALAGTAALAVDERAEAGMMGGPGPASR